ncbi:MAG: TRAP transporter small permease [Alphaproteobacteria bacterium]|nr:TRAP transporter small permease [Alphaproteobacteria bacterium]
MAGLSVEAAPSATPLGRADRALSRIEDALALVAAVSIFFLMFVGVFQVVGRTLFNTAIYGYIDWIEQASALFAFLGVAYCQRLGGHVRMEIFLAKLPRHWMWIGEALAIFIALVVISFLVKSSFDNFYRAWTLGDSTIDIRLPVWPSKAVVPFALSLLWLRLVVQLAGYWRMVLYPAERPVAIPVILSVEEQAKAEIEEAISIADRETGSKS